MKAQVSLEFIITMGFAVLMLVSLLAIGAEQLNTAVNDKQVIALNDVCLVVQQELTTAAAVHDGYSRNFTLPATIRNKPYIIAENSTGQVGVYTITTGSLTQSIRAPPCNGTLQPGKNTLRTQGGVILCS